MKRLSLLMGLLLLVGSTVWAGEIEVVNPKAAFPEGPMWHQGKLLYVEYGGHTLMSWDGKSNTVLWKKKGCGPSAVTTNAEGDFLITCYDSNQIAKVSPTGETLATYAQSEGGTCFTGPNDFARDTHGGVFFTASGPWASEPIVGKIFYISAEGEITEKADDLHYANGLALSADGKTLYCAESEAGRVIQFDVGDNSDLSNRRLFVRVGVVDPQSGASAYPDGLKMDSKGNLYVGQFSSGRIVVVTPDKTLQTVIEVPSPSAPNLAFGPEEDTAYVMAVDEVNEAPYWGKVYAVDLE